MLLDMPMSMSSSEIWSLKMKKLKLMTEMLTEWDQKGVDVIVAPGFGLPAPKIGFAPWVQAAASYTRVFNLLNFCVGSMPVSLHFILKISADQDISLELRIYIIFHYQFNNSISFFRCIFPTGFVGILSTNMTPPRNFLASSTLFATKSIISCSVKVDPGTFTTAAVTYS